MNFKEYDILVKIAQECHRLNNELMLTNGEIQNAADWSELDSHTKFMNLKSVKKILDNPDITAKDIHDEWMKNKMLDGWTYGEVKDANLKTHPLIIDFELLNDVDKMKDQIFIDVVNKNRSLYRV